MYDNKIHRQIVEDRGYKYIGTYKSSEITIENKNKSKTHTYIRVQCPYCGRKYDTTPSSFKKGINCSNCCNKYENSLAYYIQQKLKEPLNKYWDWEKNTDNPYLIYRASNKKVWIKCDKVDYHESYELTCNNFYNGNRCPYCSHKGNHLHPKDSFGYLCPQMAKYWSKNNKKSPFEVAPCSGQEFKFYCEDCGEEFKTALSNITSKNRSMKCINCTSSKGEQRIKEWLINNKIEFKQQKTFKRLIGVGNGLLSYDFYLPKYNLLIEYQGIQHEQFVEHLQENKKNFIIQKEHDRRKEKYARDNNIKLLEIWYYDYENIEEILNNNIKI